MAARKTTATKETKAKKTQTTAAATRVSSKTKAAASKVSRKADQVVESGDMKEVRVRRISKRTIAIAATLIVLAGLLYLVGKYMVIAWVDSRPITRFQLFQNLEQRYGKDTREQLIVQELIIAEARNKGIVVTDFEVDQEIAKIEEQQGGKDQLDQILQVQGISQPEFRNLIKLQLLRTKIFGEGVNVTDQDVDSYITQNKENLPAATDGATPQDKDKLRMDVREQLKQQQVSQKFNAWLQTTLQSERVRRS